MGKEKAEALELIKKLPEDVTTDAIMEEIYFKGKEKGTKSWKARKFQGRFLTATDEREVNVCVNSR